MLQLLTAYLVTVAVFLALDFAWLSKIAKRFYVERIGHLLLEKPKMPAAAAFYAVYAVGLVIFAVAPALSSGSAGSAATFGALFGFFTYATYDMTNYATLRNWSLTVSLVDVAWGTCLNGTAALLGYLGTRLFIPA